MGKDCVGSCAVRARLRSLRQLLVSGGRVLGTYVLFTALSVVVCAAATEFADVSPEAADGSCSLFSLSPFIAAGLACAHLAVLRGLLVGLLAFSVCEFPLGGLYIDALIRIDDAIADGLITASVVPVSVFVLKSTPIVLGSVVAAIVASVRMRPVHEAG